MKITIEIPQKLVDLIDEPLREAHVLQHEDDDPSTEELVEEHCKERIRQVARLAIRERAQKAAAEEGEDLEF